MRPLNLVIDAILNVAKLHEFKDKTQFLTELRTIEASYDVKELNSTENRVKWATVGSKLRQYLEPLDTDWKKTIGELYRGQEDFTRYL